MARIALLTLWFALQLAALVASVRYLWSVAVNPDKAWAIARAYDRLANVSANGSERETISSRAYRAQTEGRRWGCVLCKLLDKIDPGHCDKSAGV